MRAIVRIDSALCQGHGRCYTLADELFAEDEYGYAQVRGDGDVAPELVEVAALAVENCPERAIRLERDGARQ